MNIKGIIVRKDIEEYEFVFGAVAGDVGKKTSGRGTVYRFFDLDIGTEKIRIMCFEDDLSLSLVKDGEIIVCHMKMLPDIGFGPAAYVIATYSPDKFKSIEFSLKRDIQMYKKKEKESREKLISELAAFRVGENKDKNDLFSDGIDYTNYNKERSKREKGILEFKKEKSIWTIEGEYEY